MPYKHNESRRHKIEKARYKVTNWPEYNKALRQRGYITIWFTEEALAAWHLAKTGARGRPQEYSDLAIETALFIRQVFHLPLRQTEGFMNSLTRLISCCRTDGIRRRFIQSRYLSFMNSTWEQLHVPRSVFTAGGGIGLSGVS
jgi:hypothetical protein